MFLEVNVEPSINQHTLQHW